MPSAAMTTDKLIVLITGANQGLGYYAAQQLASSGKYIVLVGSRDETKGKNAVQQILKDNAKQVPEADIDSVQLDITSDDSITAAARYVQDKYGRLDVLVNNAAISMQNPDPNSTTRSMFQQCFDTNVFGTFTCTEAFIPLLRKSQFRRIQFVSSGLGSLALAADPQSTYPGKLFPIYRTSKTALNMIAVHFASLLEAEDFTVTLTCPGFCSTNLNEYQGTKPPDEGARVIQMAIEAERSSMHYGFVNFEEGVVGRHPW